MSNWHTVCGVGIKLTDKMIDVAIKRGIFPECMWDDDEEWCLGQLGVRAQQAGSNEYGFCWYLFVDGDTLGEVNRNANDFLKKIRCLGVDISKEDLLIVDETFIWY